MSDDMDESLLQIRIEQFVIQSCLTTGLTVGEVWLDLEEVTSG
jgi:hypothetical protein